MPANDMFNDKNRKGAKNENVGFVSNSGGLSYDGNTFICRMV